PNIVIVSMTSLKTADCGEAFAAVFTQNQRAVGFENTIGIFWIDNQPREIKRTPHHPIAFVALLPGRAAVIRNKQRARRRFDKTVNAFWIRRCDRDREPAVRFLRKTFVRFWGNFGPALAAVVRTEQSAR